MSFSGRDLDMYDAGYRAGWSAASVWAWFWFSMTLLFLAAFMWEVLA